MPQQTTDTTLSARFRDNFEDGTRARGSAYAAAGRVTLKDASATETYATVRGTGIYHAAILLGPRGVSASCTCPFYAARGFCKHLWATLLVAERRGFLGGLRAVLSRPRGRAVRKAYGLRKAFARTFWCAAAAAARCGWSA
jgi:uncharacterized Zn finger protein